MAFAVKLSASAWDAVAYVRNQIEDLTVPFAVSDAAFSSYAEDVLEDFERWVPVVQQVGNVYANTSPMVTVVGQQRYLCTTANGFVDGLGAPLQPTRIIQVGYRAASGYSAAQELTYLTLLPFSPIDILGDSNTDILANPSIRYLRDKAFNELEHYGQGFAEVVQDVSGNWALDLYPVPLTSGLPIFVRYNVAYSTTSVNGALLIPTVPEYRKRHFAKLLLALVKEQECERLAKSTDQKIGIIQEKSSPDLIRKAGIELRESVYWELGGNVPAALAST